RVLFRSQPVSSMYSVGSCSTGWLMEPPDMAALNQPVEHEPTLYMEDTGWPHDGMLDDYYQLLGDLYAPMLKGSKLLELQAAFQPAYGTGRRAEIVLWQKILDHQGLLK